MKTYKIDMKVGELYCGFSEVQQYFFDCGFFWVIQEGEQHGYPAGDISYINIKDEGHTQ